MKKKWYKTFWFRVLALISAILFLGVLLFFILVFFSIRADIRNGIGAGNISTNVSRYDLSFVNKEGAVIAQDSDSPSFGNELSPITVVQFSDFRCPYCKELAPIIRRLSVEYRDSVRFIFRDFPLIGEDSYTLALAGRCAHEQNLFFAFHDKIYGNKSPISLDVLLPFVETVGIDSVRFGECVNSRRYADSVDKDIKDAGLLDVTGTPTLFINGYKIPGAPSYDVLKRIFDTTLN